MHALAQAEPARRSPTFVASWASARRLSIIGLSQTIVKPRHRRELAKWVEEAY